mgnify:CR=1 FL=1
MPVGCATGLGPQNNKKEDNSGLGYGCLIAMDPRELTDVFVFKGCGAPVK